MSTKKSKYQSKGSTPNSARGSRTPNLNATLVMGRPGCSSSTYKKGSGLKASRSDTSMDTTIAAFGRQSSMDRIVGPSGCPLTKAHLAGASPKIDYDLECDFVCNEYLQALMKKQIASNLTKKHEQDFKDQLVLQKDNLHESRMAFRKKKQEVQNLEMLAQIDELVKVLEGTTDTFSSLMVNTNLRNTLQQLVEVLETYCNQVHLRDIKPITDQEGFDKFEILLKKYLEVIEKIKSSGRNMETVNQLGDLIKKLKEVSNSAVEKQVSIADIQKNETHRCLKMLSDMYAEKEKYGEEIASSEK